MPQRVTTVLAAALGVLGLGVLVVLFLLRVDARRAAATGPRWKRRLVGAGLALLAATGNTAYGQSQPAERRPACYAPVVLRRAGDAQLAADPAWKTMCQAWAEAREVVSGARGEYPFDAAGQKAMMASLAQAQSSAVYLGNLGMLTTEESALLKADLAALSEGVAAFRSTEMKAATCYRPISPGVVAQRRVEDLEGRLALLDALAEQAKVRPMVVGRVLGTVERQAGLLDETALKAMDPKQRAKATQVRNATMAKVKAIRAKLPKAAPEDSPEWTPITDAWEFASPLARSLQSTEAQRQAAETKFAAAKAAADSLAAAGLLAPEEAALLAREADRIMAAIQSTPPTDSQVTCYKMAFIPPARESMGRLSGRLPLLRSLAGSGKVHPAALAKVVPAIEADLATLSDPARTRDLTPAERTQAAKLHKQASQDLAKLKKMMGESK